MMLYILISTIDEGIARVEKMLGTPSDEVRYVVVWQQTEAFKARERMEHGCQKVLRDMMRKDVILKQMEGGGLCRSRNKALEMVMMQGEEGVCVIADDDECFVPQAFERIKKYYEEHENTDIVLFRLKNERGEWMKRYPAKEIDYEARERWYYVSSCEMTFRTKVVNDGLYFDERFGLGSERLIAGEEDVFLHEALQKGMCVRVVPEEIASTAQITTGADVLNVKVLRSKGAVYAMTLEKNHVWLRCVREAWGLSRRTKTSFFFIYRNIKTGVKYIKLCNNY